MLKKALTTILGSDKDKTAAPTAWAYPEWIAFEPALVPPPELMQTEGIHILEEWYRWAEEWSFMLKAYGRLSMDSHVLEIGCGLGRTAFPLRYILLEGTYDGFEICKFKVDFLQSHFTPAHPNFNFKWASIHNTFYNPEGEIQAAGYTFPYGDQSFDVVYAASVFTHLLPDITANYFKETARVLKPDGRAVFSFFIFDHYRPGQPRPLSFAHPCFNFDHRYGSYGDDFAIANPDNPEEMTAYTLSLIEKYAADAGLALAQPPVPGLWSGSTKHWIGAQDLIVLQKV